MIEPVDRPPNEYPRSTWKQALQPLLLIPATILVSAPLIYLSTQVISQSWLVELCGNACTPHGLEFIRNFYSD